MRTTSSPTHSNNLPLKINKDSHIIKKSPSSSSSSSSSLQHRHPVIIYTHSPKIIHTHPRDFMALVQKLTGLSGENAKGNSSSSEEENKSGKITCGNDNNESSSTGENEGQVNYCFPFMRNNILPVFTPKCAEFIWSNQSFYNYPRNINMGGSIE